MKKILYIILFLPLFYSSQNWQWAKQIGSANASYVETANSVITDGVNLYIIGAFDGTMNLPGGGTLNCNGNNDIYVIKFDANGNRIWAKRFGGSFNQPYSFEGARGVYDSINKCIYLAGEIIGTVSFPPLTANGSSNNADIFVARMDTSGTFAWVKVIGAPGSGGIGDDRADIYLEPDGDVLLIGGITDTCNIGSFSVPGGGFFARYDSLGNCKWAAHKYDDAFHYEIRAAFIDSDIVLAGSYATNPSYIDTVSLVSQGSYDGFIARTDSAGNVIWIKKFGGVGFDGATSISTDANNNIYVGGSFSDTINIGGFTISNATSDNFIAKLDQNGNVKWVKQTHSTGSNNWTDDLVSDSNGNCYVTGGFSGNSNFGTYNLNTSNTSDVFIGRFDSAGTWLGVANFGNANGSAVSVDNSGSVYCGGYFRGNVSIGSTSFTSIDNQDVFIAKLDAITGINNLKQAAQNNQLIIYANPNKGTFNIKVPDEIKDLSGATLVVNDNTGKEVVRFELGSSNNNNTPHFDVSNAAEGFYTVKLITKDKKVYTGKLVVE